MINSIIHLLRSMSKMEADAKIHRQQERYKQHYIKNAYKQAQLKHIQKKYNNTKHK